MGLIRRSSHTLLACVLLGTALAPFPASAVTLPAAAAVDDGAVARVTQELDAAEATAAQASRRALDASAAAERTRLLAESTASRAADLTTRSDAADTAMESATAAAGLSAARLYRTVGGGPLVAQLLTDADPDSLLQRLGILDRVSAAAARTAGTARSAADVATSLRAQAEQARDEAARLAQEAQSAAAEAQAQADAESSAVTAAQARLDDLYAQLAALRETTAAEERAARQREKAQQDAAAPGGATGGGAASGGSTSAGSGSTGGGAAPANGGSGGGSGSSGGSGSGGGSGSSGGSGGGSGSSGGSGSGSIGGSGSGGASGGGGGATAPAGPIMSPNDARAHARGALGGWGWGDDQYSCLNSLWNRESGWRADALNPSSGAYGIPQALPGEKMASAGLDWRTNAVTQISWGLSYIKSRYGSPCGAWDHSERTGWY
ncbi:hypothetical protein [uncultured Microbacterium sp.]|uniref:aggregation-promoting factor C-terminal-like domain-containing protein n=1 Tax=uncultured Microbacterium sp. TaxID=191216 RepID=UPI0025F95676|nr:hypothetical protein [uncultured Microbacterium sp.]